MKLAVGQTYNKTFKISADMIEKFAKVTGDFNPLHLDKDYAEKTIFGKPIAHGFLIGSFISTVLGNEYPGAGTIYLSQSMKFLKPVHVNDKIKVCVELLGIDSNRHAMIKTACFNHRGELVLDGKARVILSSRMEI